MSDTTPAQNDPTLDENGQPHDHDTIAPDPALAHRFVDELQEGHCGDSH